MDHPYHQTCRDRRVSRVSGCSPCAPTAREIAWLSGTPMLRDEHVVWFGPHGVVAPSGADLPWRSDASIRFRRYPLAAGAGARRSPRRGGPRYAESARARQAAARARLHRPAVSHHRAQRGDSDAIAALTCLLAIGNGGARGAAIRSQQRTAALRCTCGSSAAGHTDARRLPAAVRAAAALVLGALARSGGGSSDAMGTSADETQWIRRAYAWGHRHGLPATPALVTLLLRDRQGPMLVDRCLARQSEPLHVTGVVGPSPADRRDVRYRRGGVDRGDP